LTRRSIKERHPAENPERHGHHGGKSKTKKNQKKIITTRKLKEGNQHRMYLDAQEWRQTVLIGSVGTRGPDFGSKNVGWGENAGKEGAQTVAL